MTVLSLVSRLFALGYLGLVAASPGHLDTRTEPISFLQGTYNVSFWALPLPVHVAKAMLPKTVSKDPNPFLNVNPDGTVTAVIEAGKQTNNGPPGFGVLNNEEAKVEIPAVRRVSSSNQPFIYKSQIYTDNFLASSSAAVVFGLPSTKQSITPKDSGNAPDYSYTVKNYFQVTNVRARTVNGQTDVFDWTNTANQPWFGDGLLCGQHTYEPTTYEYLSADITLFPAALKQDRTLSFKDVPGIHFVDDWKISGPASCKSYIKA